MKIAIIGSRGYPYVYSGYETFVKELSERLVKEGIEVRIYCHKSLFSNRPKSVNGIELVYIPAIETKVLSQLSHSFLAMLHCCFSREIDMILAVNTANGPFGIFSRLFRKKTAINLDGLEWERPKWKGLGSKYFYFASWLSTKLYDRLVNDSDEMRRVYQELFNKDSKVIAYGANIRESNSPELIRKWGLEPDNYYLIVGRLIPDNNADIIVKGFVASNSKKKLVIVGDVPYKDQYATAIKSEAEADDRLLFPGYVKDQDELAELYHNAYCYLHGHEYGGTNPTMLKAMAYGCAIGALDTPFNNEMLQSGKHGVFFAKNEASVEEMINDMDADELMIDELKKIAKEGITEKYTWEQVTKSYLALFKEMSGSR